MAYELLGKDFIPADVEPKVTGRAKYAEDFRVEGMVFCRLLMSPVPRGRVTRIDTGRAEAMPGVVGILTADEVPSHPMNPILSNDPLYVGQPILAVAAVDETTAMDAIEAIDVEIEPLDESFVTAANSHHSMEPRTNMAYWEDGRCHLFASSQSQSFILPELARLMDVPEENFRLVAEYCGGGFGSKGHAYPLMAIPALLSRKIGRPVMMRVSRADEYFLGTARGGFQGRIRLGFRADGRILSADLRVVQDGGPTEGFFDFRSAAEHVAVVLTPVAMRTRGVPVHTNTIPRGPQRGPGQNQMAAAAEPILDKAALELGIDRLEIRRINAPRHDSVVEGRQVPVTSAYMLEALDQGAAAFNWQEKRTRSGQRDGSKVRGVAIGQGFHNGSFAGFDGLVRLTPEGRLHIHTGVGNLGTYSHTATSRVAAEMLKCSWENCVVERGDTNRHLPFNSGQFGSNTSGTQTRTTYAAAMDAVEKLKAIAAMDLGGDAADYDIGDEKVFRRSDPSVALTYPAAARRAIELGGRYDGHAMPENLNSVTKRAVAGLAGTGLVGVARDQLELPGVVPALAVGVKGIGEPVMGAAASALICAISDALGGHYFNRAPVVADMIVNAASGREQSHRRLQVSTA